jgi:hypothetical protein
VSPFDLIGLAGVVVVLVAYAAATTGRLDPERSLSLGLNAIGAGLILASLTQRFNLAATIVEGAWCLIALVGLLRRAWARIRSQRSDA